MILAVCENCGETIEGVEDCGKQEYFCSLKCNLEYQGDFDAEKELEQD